MLWERLGGPRTSSQQRHRLFDPRIGEWLQEEDLDALAMRVAEAQAAPVQIRLRKVAVSMVMPEARVKMLPKNCGEHGLL